MTSTRTARDVDSGWSWLVLIAVYCGIVIVSTSAFMSGVLYIALLERYGGDEAKTSLIGSLNTGLLCLLGPFASVVMETTSCRFTIVTGGVLLSLSYLLSAFMNSLDWLIVTNGVLGGIGSALACLPYIVVLGYYFEKRRNLVISLSVAVIGVGMFIAAPMALTMLDTFGLHGTYLLLSAFNANICVVGLICKPSSVELRIRKRKNQKLHDQNVVKKQNQYQSWLTVSLNKLSNKFSVDLFHNVPLVLFMLSTLTWNLMQAVCLMHLPNYVSGKGAHSTEITIIMTCYSVSNAMGRFLSALTVDRRGLDSLMMHIVMLGIAGIVTFTFPFYSDIPFMEYIFAVVIGIFTGSPNSLTTPITLTMVGVEHLSAAHGLEYFFAGIGFVVGPPIVGVLYGKTGSYDSSFYFAGSVVLVGSFLAILCSFKRRALSGFPGDPMEVITVANETELEHTEKLLTPDKGNQESKDSTVHQRIDTTTRS